MATMPMRCRKLVFPIAVLLSLAGCGGGGGGTTTTTSSTPTSVTRQVNIPYVNVTICVPGNGAAPTYNNVLPISVDSGPSTGSAVTQAQASPLCQTIDHVLVDTGSSGLRLFAPVLNSSVLAALPAQPAGGGSSLAECTVFANGVTWGSVRLADIYLSGEAAANVPIQVISDPTFPGVPVSCSNQGVMRNTVQSFGANGILGLSTFAQDCGSYCTTNAGPYFACTSSSCSPVAVSLARQVPNPVTKFVTPDNNGILVTLPAVPASGAATISGSLIFGIGTQGNNALGAATQFDLDPATGNLTTVYTNPANPATPVTFTNTAFLDSGSNALFFPDSTIPGCSASTVAPGFYCPSSTLSLSGTIQGSTNAQSTTIPFNIVNADALFSGASTYAAFKDIGGPFVSANAFDWGLPFFYGRSVFFAIEAPYGPGPYVAF